MINAEIILATRPHNAVGLATFVVEVPAYIWMELLTHKRIARNANSARAQSHSRHAAQGYYVPDQFYRQGTWMSPGDSLDSPANLRVTMLVNEYYAECERRIVKIIEASNGGIAKEQINRLMPISRMMRGIMTATEPAWRAMLALRDHPAADAAMRIVASQIADALETAQWAAASRHVPFDAGDGLDCAAARIARITTGAPGAGQRNDADLAEDLRKSGHWSPFEHIAIWTRNPLPSALCSLRDDLIDTDRFEMGWQSYRAELESL